MDFDKAKRDAQEQVDRALAEVDRLKTVAKDLEESTKKTEAFYVNKEASLKAALLAVENDFSDAQLNLKNLTNSIQEVQSTKTAVVKEIDARREDLASFEVLIAEKQTLLKSIEDSIIKITEKQNISITEKEHELESIEREIAITIASGAEDEAELNKVLNKLKNQVATEETIFTKLKEEQIVVADATKLIKTEAAAADHRKDIAELELSKAESKLAAVVAETATQVELLAATKKEVEAVQAELKPLLAERINSIGFMNELVNKEATLKQKYEKVGLDYK